MDTGKMILVLIHIALAATAFGVTLASTGGMRRARAYGSDALKAAARDLARRGGIAGITGTLAVATGIGLIFVNGGFKVMPPNYHAAMGLGVLMVALGLFVLKPAAARLVAAVDAGDDAGLDRQLKTLNIGSGVMQLLWVTVLVMMYVQFG